MLVFSAIAALLSVLAIAVDSSITVDLQSSWNAPPFELSVIESITQENSTAFFPLLSAYLALKEARDEPQTDEQFKDELIQHSIDTAFLSKDQVEFVDWSLALNSRAGVIQAYYQYFNTAVAPQLKEKCDNVLYYNSKYSCDKDSVFAFESDAGRDVEIFPTDKIIGQNSKAPIAVLYADITSEDFSMFHSHLMSSAMNNKIQYILRYKPSRKFKSLKQGLSGYGVELALKRTDYIVIDDRKDEKGKKKSSDDEVVSEDDNAKISKKELKLLGLRAANFIMSSSNKFDALHNTSSNFPKVMNAVAQMDPDSGVKEDVLANSEVVLGPGQSAMVINGAPVSQNDAFQLFETVQRERGFVRGLQKFGLNKTSAAEIIAENHVGHAQEGKPTRYDYRSEGLIWLNDLEIDSQYKQFPPDLDMFLDEDLQGQFYPVRHNVNSLVFALDMSSPQHLSLLMQAYTFIQRGLPIQIGIIPMAPDFESKKIAKEMTWIANNKVAGATHKYLRGLFTETDNPFKMAVGDNAKVDFSEDADLKVIMERVDEWVARFDVPENEPMIFANGVNIAPSGTWLMEASEVFTVDLPEIREIIKNDKPDASFPIRDRLIDGASTRRNTLVTPSDPTSVKYMDTNELYDLVGEVIPSVESTGDNHTTFILTGDFASPEPLDQLIELVKFVKETNGIKVTVMPLIDRTKKNTSVREKRREAIVQSIQSLNLAKVGVLAKAFAALKEYHFGDGKEVDEPFMRKAGWDSSFNPTGDVLKGLSDAVADKLALYVGLQPPTLIASGRVITLTKTLTAGDLKDLHNQISLRNKAITETAKRRGVDIDNFETQDRFVTRYTKTYYMDDANEFFLTQTTPRVDTAIWTGNHSVIELGNNQASLSVVAAVDPISERGQQTVAYLNALAKLDDVHIRVYLNPMLELQEMPLKRFYRACMPVTPVFENGTRQRDFAEFTDMPQDTLYNMEIHTPAAWSVDPEVSDYDLENIVLDSVTEDKLRATYELRSILLEGHCRDDTTRTSPRGLTLDLGTAQSPHVSDTIVMANLGYFQFQSNPGYWSLNVKDGRSSEVFDMVSSGLHGYDSMDKSNKVWMTSMTGTTIYPRFKRKKGQEIADVLEPEKQSIFKWGKKKASKEKKHADVNIFTVASGHLYERFLSIMTASVMKHSAHTVKFWLIEQFLSPSFKKFLPTLAQEYGFEYELITYKWPHWLRSQREKQRTIWGYKILFLDVLFPQSLDKVVFVDADQIVRTDLKELVDMDLDGAPYGYTPMCDSREEMEGFRFWKQGYWKTLLGDKHKYHISALYVVDLNRFRQMAAGDRIREHYQRLSADPGSLSNLDQDLPNNMQSTIPIFSLPQNWLWCETWCSDESLKTAKTIDMCNNPLTKEPKLDRARRQVPEWTEYDNAIAKLQRQFEQSFCGSQEVTDDEAEENEAPSVEHDHDEL